MDKRTPVLRPKEAVRAFEKLGYSVARSNGSHITLVKSGAPSLSLVGDKNKTMSKMTLRLNIQRAGITVDEFNNLL